MRRKTVATAGDPLRWRSLAIIKREVIALRSGVADQVSAVWTAAEIETLQRLAKGEVIVGIDLSQERAARELRRIAVGGRYGYTDEDAGA